MVNIRSAPEGYQNMTKMFELFSDPNIITFGPSY